MSLVVADEIQKLKTVQSYDVTSFHVDHTLKSDFETFILSIISVILSGKVFLGQKYGYRPIPTYILSSELQLIRDELAATGHDPALIDTWYRKDSNAVPPISVLQPISSILINFNNKRIPKLQAEDQAKWWDTLNKFQKLFRKAAASLNTQGKMDNDATHNYFMSVTEREVINGILSVKNTKNHCLAYIRYINNINLQNLKKASLFVDIINRYFVLERNNNK